MNDTNHMPTALEHAAQRQKAITAWLREQGTIAGQQAEKAKSTATLLIDAPQQHAEAQFVQLSIIAQTLSRAADVIDSGEWENAAPKS